jgi:glycerol kinase
MPRYIAAIDQGTTSTRCILFDYDSRAVASAQREHEQIFPAAGWVEHDPMEIWHRTEEVITTAIRAANVTAGDIAAVGIANQRETTVVWDPMTGRPLCNAIVWQDTRTKALCDVLVHEIDPIHLRKRIGLPVATYFSGPKIRWMLENVSGLSEAVRAKRGIVGTIDSWLIWNLTGGVRGGQHVIDVTNASRTMLMDLHTLQWDQRMLNHLHIPREMLPKIVSSSAPGGYGQTLFDGPFGDAINVCGDLGDQHAALVGQACFEPGESKNTYGTGCFMLLNTGGKPVESTCGLLTTMGYQFGDQPPVYALEGSVAVTGALVQWLRDNLGVIHTSAEVEALAASVADNGGVYVVPAFSGLFAPYWRSDARGVIVGLTRQSNRAHLARATLEATAFQTRDIVQAMIQDCGVPVAKLKVDGGMCVNELLMQFQADLLGVEVVRPQITETTALGAAYAAGLAVGFWKNLDELKQRWRHDKSWHPRMSPAERARLCARWSTAVERSLGWET